MAWGRDIDPVALDRYLTGGDPHPSTYKAKCPNPDCPEFGVVYTFDVTVEYGMVVDDLECDTCDTILADADDYLPDFREDEE